MIDNKNAQNSLSEIVAEQTCDFLLQACHTSIYSIKSQGRQVSFWTFKAVTHTEE